MIYYLNGVLKAKEPTLIILDVQGVGYEIRIPISTYEKLPAVNQPCSVFTHLYLSLNQDEIRLYGFAGLAEKALFLKLIGISGIGPKIALSVISSMNTGMIIKAIRQEEDGLLSRVPGIGKKTAQRIIMELKDNIADLSDMLDVSEKSVMDSSFAEAEKALVALGYPVKDIQRALHSINEAEKALPVEQLIKLVIRYMYQKK